MFRQVNGKPVVHSSSRPDEIANVPSDGSQLVEFSSYTLTRRGMSDNLEAFDLVTRSPLNKTIGQALTQLFDVPWQHPWITGHEGPRTTLASIHGIKQERVAVLGRWQVF